MALWKRRLLTLLCTLLPVLVAAGLAVAQSIQNEYTLELSLEGEQQIVLEYGQAYRPQGASARFWGTVLHTVPEELAVQVDDPVDERKPGVYRVSYTATCRGVTKSVYRTVTVVDSVSPVITLTTDPADFTLPGYPYRAGYTATDNCDGDITDRVTVHEDNGNITYTVSDSSGNAATVTRYVAVSTPDAPVLFLNGGTDISVTAGYPYIDPGCTALGSDGRDLTGDVTVGGWVDCYMPGTYTLGYQVTDSSGKVTTATRRVTVLPHPVQVQTEAPEKVIYLTFDDGPGPATGRLLDVLGKYQIQATFFVVNTRYISTIQRAAAEGHTVAPHTATHKFRRVYASEEAYFSDLQKMQDVIYHYTGTQARILRFPGGSSNTISRFNPGIMSRLVPMVRQRGMRYFDWNVDSKDAGGATTTQEVFANVVAGVGNKTTAVVLQHDIKGFSVDAVERIINWGLANGYTFLPLDENSPVCEHNIYN